MAAKKIVTVVTEDASEPREPEESEPKSQVESIAQTPINVSAQVLAEAIVKAGEQTTGQRRKVPFGMHKTRSPFNPTGKTRKLNRVVYQSGVRLNVKTLTDGEIELLNSGQIAPGRYIDKLVTVKFGDSEEGESALFISYKNKTADQRMALGSRLGTGGGKTGFENMLRLIVAEIEDQKRTEKARRRQEVEEAMS